LWCHTAVKFTADVASVFKFSRYGVAVFAASTLLIFVFAVFASKKKTAYSARSGKQQSRAFAQPAYYSRAVAV
jgi:hypothetical protein